MAPAGPASRYEANRCAGADELLNDRCHRRPALESCRHGTCGSHPLEPPIRVLIGALDPGRRCRLAAPRLAVRRTSRGVRYRHPTQQHRAHARCCFAPWAATNGAERASARRLPMRRRRAPCFTWSPYGLPGSTTEHNATEAESKASGACVNGHYLGYATLAITWPDGTIDSGWWPSRAVHVTDCETSS